MQKEENYQVLKDDDLSSINNLIVKSLNSISKNNSRIEDQLEIYINQDQSLQNFYNKLIQQYKEQTIKESLSQILDYFAKLIKKQQDNTEITQSQKLQENLNNKQQLQYDKQQSEDTDNINENYQNYVQLNPPFLRKKISQKYKYTLILDLDETLIHYVDTPSGGHFLTRPYLETFLRELKDVYEIVVFTAGMEDYANWVIDTFDKNKYIKYRLFRQHTKFSRSCYIKDLTKIGRSLQTSIIIDNTPENYKLQNANGIRIKTWLNDPHDTALKDLIPVLKQLIENDPTDIRVPMKEIGKSEIVQEIYSRHQQLRNQLQKQQKYKKQVQTGYNLPFSFPQ